jgi:hypothetical protein
MSGVAQSPTNGQMAVKKQHSITSLPPSPDEERRTRTVKYLIAMGIRMVCLILVFVLPDWWRLVPLIGAVVLPYFAVVIANVSMQTNVAEVERPGTIDVYRP